MSESTLPSLSNLPPADAQYVRQRCRDFEDQWRSWQGGARPVLADRMLEVPGRLRAVLLGELLRLDVEYRRRKAREQPVLADYLDDFRADAAVLRRVFPEPVRSDGEGSPADSTREHTPADDIDETDERVPPAASALPERIARYRITGVLGQGGFGVVFRAHDDQLSRDVAIKVPHRRLVARPEGAAPYLAEARTIASLDHPNIVPVHDVGSTEHFPFFVVSKYIDGCSLARRLKQSRPALLETVELIATIAEALHHAHKQGIVHRDIKPGNILLDRHGKPFVADFGLALREQDVGKGPHYAGTPPYMSPEQARGEGNQVDGRSDIFSLGVMFYELLVGRRPFQGASRDELLQQISNHEARPPRQCDDTIPMELERICLKALAKRFLDRYTTARDMADELRQFLRSASVRHSDPGRFPPAHDAPGLTPTSYPTPTCDHGSGDVMPQPSSVVATPPPARPARKLLVGLAICIVLAGLGFAAVALRPGDAPAPIAPELPAGPRALDGVRRDAPIHLLERRPLPVGWDVDNPRWQSWNADEKLLEVTGGPSRLFVLGTTTLPSYDFGVDIRQAPWTGEVGVFWGFHEDETIKERRLPRQEFGWFHFLRIEHRINAKGEPARRVHRGKGSLRYNDQHEVAVAVISLITQDIGFLAGQVHLKIEVKRNRLINAEIAHERLAELCSDQANKLFQTVPYHGGIGLLALSHSATFSEVRFVSRSSP